MVNIAIAGGTGSVGRTIFEEVKRHPQHRGFILTRNVNRHGLSTTPSALQVDYENTDALTAVLEEHEIDTVISCLNYAGNNLKISQANLIQAASRSAATKKFIPSTFGINYPSGHPHLPILADYHAAIASLRETTDLQWTVIQNGCFLDYWGMPHIETHLRPSSFGIDIASRRAAIPGDGNSPFSVTYSGDVARYVVAMCLDDFKDEWPEVTRLAGDIVTWNEFVKVAEEVVGEKFQVTYDPIESLERGELTELPSQIPCYEAIPRERFRSFMAIFSRWTADEEICRIAPELNGKFPGIKPLTVRGMIERCWKKNGE